MKDAQFGYHGLLVLIDFLKSHKADVHITHLQFLIWTVNLRHMWCRVPRVKEKAVSGHKKGNRRKGK